VDEIRNGSIALLHVRQDLAESYCPLLAATIVAPDKKLLRFTIVAERIPR